MMKRCDSRSKIYLKSPLNEKLEVKNLEKKIRADLLERDKSYINVIGMNSDHLSLTYHLLLKKL